MNNSQVKNFSIIHMALFLLALSQLIAYSFNAYRKYEWSSYLKRADHIQAQLISTATETVTRKVSSHSSKNRGKPIKSRHKKNRRTETFTQYNMLLQINYAGKSWQHRMIASHQPNIPDGQPIDIYIDRMNHQDVRVPSLNQNVVSGELIHLAAAVIATFFITFFAFVIFAIKQALPTADSITQKT